MATVRVFNAARMLAIEAASIVSGAVNGSGNLILTKHDGGTVDAGRVKGADGANGTNGTNGVDATSPSGGVIAYAGAAAPTGWLLCDGSSLLRASYPALFTAIGVTYGSADGTHFSLPDLRGRTVVAAGTGSGLTARALAASGGEESHVLTTAESGLQAHTHSTPAHAHTGGAHAHTIAHEHAILRGTGSGATTRLSGNTTSSGSSSLVGQTTIDTPNSGSGGAVATDTSGAGTTGSNGAVSGSAHNNMQPWFGLNYIIKI